MQTSQRDCSTIGRHECSHTPNHRKWCCKIAHGQHLHAQRASPNHIFQDGLGSKPIAAVHIQEATFRVIRDRRTRCFAAPSPHRTRQWHRSTGYQERRYRGSLSLHTIRSKRWGFRQPPVCSSRSRSTVSTQHHKKFKRHLNSSRESRFQPAGGIPVRASV